MNFIFDSSLWIMFKTVVSLIGAVLILVAILLGALYCVIGLINEIRKEIKEFNENKCLKRN